MASPHHSVQTGLLRPEPSPQRCCRSLTSPPAFIRETVHNLPVSMYNPRHCLCCRGRVSDTSSGQWPDCERTTLPGAGCPCCKKCESQPEDAPLVNVWFLDETATPRSLQDICPRCNKRFILHVVQPQQQINRLPEISLSHYTIMILETLLAILSGTWW